MENRQHNDPKDPEWEIQKLMLEIHHAASAHSPEVTVNALSRLLVAALYALRTTSPIREELANKWCNAAKQQFKEWDKDEK
jgi:hypothetical protein